MKINELIAGPRSLRKWLIMLKEVDGLVREAEPLGNHLARLREATLRINGHPDSGSLRQEIVDQACFLTQATYGALLTFDENGEAVSSFRVA